MNRRQFLRNTFAVTLTYSLSGCNEAGKGFRRAGAGEAFHADQIAGGVILTIDTGDTIGVCLYGNTAGVIVAGFSGALLAVNCQVAS